MHEAPTLCPLQPTVMISPTDYWNDSCPVEELAYAVARGAVGATTNPTIVLGVLKKEMHLWRERIRKMIAEYSSWSEMEEMWCYSRRWLPAVQAC